MCVREPSSFLTRCRLWVWPLGSSGTPSRGLLLILLLALLLRLVAIPMSDRFTKSEGEDAIHFRLLGLNLAAGHGYSSSLNPPYELDPVKEPVYPAFLAIVFALCSNSVIAVQLVQAVIGTLTVLLTYRTTVEILGHRQDARRCALAAAFTLAIQPSVLRYSPVLVRETLFILIVLLCFRGFVFWTLVPRNVLVLGFLCGIGSLCRANLILLPIFCGGILMMRLRSWKRAGAAMAGLLLIELLVTLPWFARNWHSFGFVGLSPTIGVNLYQRTWALEMDGRAEPSLRAVAKRATLMTDKSDDDDLYKLTVAYRVKELVGHEYSYWDLDARFARIALENITRHPVQYILGTSREMLNWWYAGFNYSRLVRGYARGLRRNIAERASAPVLVWLLHSFGCTSLLFFVLNGARKHLRNVGAMAAFAFIFYFALTTALVQICYLDRYWMVASPFVAILVGLSVVNTGRMKGRANE